MSPAAGHNHPAGDRAETEAAPSLFAGDAAVLSDAAIAHILEYRYEPPAAARVALMPFGRQTWRTWSEELAAAAEQSEAQVLERLRAVATVREASYLPTILIPERRTVPRLREAAARYQADILLIYRSHCDNFNKYRMFRPGRSRAFCTVEAVLLDTRTGLVPFTSTASRRFDLVEDPQDVSFAETRMKAQLAAIGGALDEISAEVAAFLAAE